MKRRQGKWHIGLNFVLMITAVLLGLNGIGYAAEAEKAPIKIGAISSWEIMGGLGVKQGTEMAVDDLNKAGGLLGRKLIGVYYDAKSNVDEAKKATERALYRDKADVIVAPHRSDLAIVTQPLVMESKKMFLIGGPASPILTNRRMKEDYETYKYTFATMTNSDFMAYTLYGGIDIARKMGLNKLALACEKAAWIDPIYDVIERKYADIIVYKTRFSTTASNFNTEWTKVKESGADMLWVVATGSAGTPLTLQWYDMKVPAMLLGYTNDGQDPRFWELTGGKCQGVQNISAGLVVGVDMTKKSLPFAKAYEDKYGRKLPVYSIGYTYDIVMAWAQGVKLAGTIDSDAVVKAMKSKSFSYEGVIADIEYFDEVHNAWNSTYRKIYEERGSAITWGYTIFQWQDGKQVVLAPDKYKKGNMIIPDWVQQELKKKK